MASTTLTADRRWASSRKSGMTVLGKVPKPINLPSQRLENHGLDPNVEIVPKGTITWGSSRQTSSSNAWSSSSLLSPKIEATLSSPPDITRPGSSGSSTTRPSTGNTDRQLGPDPSHVWGPNSRPSSASGSFASGHPLASPNRPRSADTRPASSHLSRFAESSVENKGFTLSTGDFPTLGSDKPAEPHRGHSSQGRPTSGTGRDARPKETLDSPLSGQDMHVRSTSGSAEDNMPKALKSGDFTNANDVPPQNHNVNILTTDDPSNTNWYSETPYQYPTQPYHQPRPNQPNIVLPVPPPPPHQYDASSWRVPPPMQQQPHEGAMWYAPGPPHPPGPHGPGPYRPAGPPNSYPIDPYAYYPPPPLYRPSNAESAPRAHMPPPHNPYMMPAHPVSVPARPGPQHASYTPVAPVPYDGGYYGPPRTGFYGNHGHNHNNNTYNNSNNNNQQGILNQGPNKSPRSSVTGSDAAPKQYKVLLKHKEEEHKDEKQPGPTDMTCGRGDHSSELSENQQQPIVRKNTALIQKIEELNSKARSLESSHAEIKEEKPKPVEGILGTPSGVNEITGGKSSHTRTGEERRLNEQRRIKQRPVQVPNLVVVPVRTEAVMDDSATAGSDKALSQQNEGDDGTVSDANLLPSDPAEYEIQRALLKEKAAQRAKELQKEEEERIREQKAKALAKLEELNRRATTQQKEPIHRESDDSHLQQEPPMITPTTDTHLQEVPPKSVENSSVATVTLSFGTISEVQITTGQVTHISEVPISAIMTSADVGVVTGTIGTGTCTGTSSHSRHHHGKQTGYKKRHGNNNLNASPELMTTDEKITNVGGAVRENPTEPPKQQTDAQLSASESTHHREDTVAHHRKRNNRNPRNRSKPEVPVPSPVVTVEERIETPDNPNSMPPQDSEQLEVELHGNGGNNNNRAGPHWKAHQQRRPVRNHRTISDKSHGNETVMWAPVRHPREESTHAATGTGDGEMHHAGTVKTKRAEMERYVPKPQLSQLEKKPDESSDVKTGENLPPREAKTGEVNTRATTNTGNNANNLNKTTRRGGGRSHASWRERVEPVEMHETSLASDTQLVTPSPATKNHEGSSSNTDGRPRRHNGGHKLYKATGSNYTGHGTIGEIVDGSTTGTAAKSDDTESGSGEVLNYSTNTTRLQHWKPKSSQSHVSYSDGRGNGGGGGGWQKVNVSDKVGPSSDNIQDELHNTVPEEFGGSRRQRGYNNNRQYKSGAGAERESNGEFQPVKNGMEGGTRVGTGSRYRGRGRNGNFARRAGE